MSIETDLRKEGIENIKPIDTIKVNMIAKSIATKLCSAFPEHGFVYSDLFILLSRLHMYTAKLPKGTSKAKYYYKNSSIYFSQDVDLNHLDSYALHECIHYLQEKKNSHNSLVRLGLCSFSEFDEYGMAINEGAVQYMTCVALGCKVEEERYYNINLATISPSYYPLECNLIRQMGYITGEYSLFDSTLNSNDAFFNQFIALCGKNTYLQIQQNMDKLLKYEDYLSSLTEELQVTDEADPHINDLIRNVDKTRNKITELFIQTQDLLITSYFDRAFDTIGTLENIEYYRRKLYNYKDLIGYTDNYSFFNSYYIDKMAELEKKYTLLTQGQLPEEELSLTIYKENKFFLFFKNIKKLIMNFFVKNTEEEK